MKTILPFSVISKFAALIGALALGLSTVVSAQPSFRPAFIADAPQALHNRLSFPEVDGDWNALVKCTAIVGEGGSMQTPICFDRDETNSPFFQEVISAGRGSQVTPAQVDGVNVYLEMFQFSVLFQQRGEQQAIVVYPHHRNNYQFYGDNYIAAQRFGTTQSADCDARTDRFGELNVRMVFSLNAQGEVGDEIEAIDETFADCVSAFEIFINKASYIPAHFNGEPVESVVVQWFYKR